MAITGIDTLDGKQIIAAGASSATNAYKAELTTGGNSLQGLYDTVSTSSGTWGGGGSFPASADEACGVVTANSGNWNSTKTTVNTYSGLWNDTRNTVGTNSANWGAAAVVTATGGTTAYVQTINNKNISATNAGSALSATDAYNLTNTAIKVASATSATNANTATYASNGVSLTNIYNSGRSGYAASAYLVNNVTGKVSDWNNCYSSYTSHSGNWADITEVSNAVNSVKPMFNRVSNYGTTNLGQLTATGVGAGKLVVDLGSIFNSGYNMIEWSYCDMNGFWGNDKVIYWFTFGARLNNVVATQWSDVSNAIKLKNANAVFLHEFAFMNGDRWSPTYLSICCTGAWSTAATVTRRDIRNTSTADNNDYYLSFNGFIYAP